MASSSELTSSGLEQTYSWVSSACTITIAGLLLNHSRCSSKVGKKYAELGGQKLSLGDGCNFEGTIAHELLHALGKKTNVSKGKPAYF